MIHTFSTRLMSRLGVRWFDDLVQSLWAPGKKSEIGTFRLNYESFSKLVLKEKSSIAVLLRGFKSETRGVDNRAGGFRGVFLGALVLDSERRRSI